MSGDVTGPSGSRSGVRLLVDTGATYTLLPLDAWTAIDLTLRRRLRFPLLDGTVVDRDVSEGHVALPEGDAHTPVIPGEAGDEAPFGVVTPEVLGCVLNPFAQTLQPMRMMLA